ncbi:SET and MYND domain-containing protein 3 [Boothiomyces macroporosus]|uniref:SET and MYND domain-containing protein 3 n=1 Tax=Boothiomyces macroporosus TaxID=261099 RepID=A0AAD5UKN9_9FUNG|nr:SET and MYND domain-containing protein 3 [Boothiomyces macroporosus]
MLIKICNYMDKGKDESVDIFSISKKLHFESLVSHMDKLSAGEIVELRLKAEASGITTHSIEQQVEILSKFRRNNFTIYDFDLFEVGSGTFCLGSMLNHSCVPNAVLIYQKREMIVLALRDIKENEEIFISYIDPINPYDSRCKMLDKYYFKCTCDKCNLKLYPKFNSPSGLEDHVTKGMEILDRYKKVSNNLETCLGFYADFELYRSVSSILLEELESATNFGLCLGLIVVKVATLIIQYPKSHPLIGLESLVGAKICWNCQQYPLGRKFLEIGNDCHSVYIDYHVNDELVKLNNLYKDL